VGHVLDTDELTFRDQRAHRHAALIFVDTESAEFYGAAGSDARAGASGVGIITG
jgi:hypothetical protein